MSIAVTSAANEKAVSRLLSAQPKLVGVSPAAKVIPGMGKKIFLHPGPPMLWNEMTGPLRGAAVGAVLFEGYARNVRSALRILQDGEIKFESAHDHDSVCAMAGFISPSLPVFVVRNQTYGNYSFSPINEGVGRVPTLRYGAYNSRVIDRLNWIRDVLMPGLHAAIRRAKDFDLKHIIAESLKRGDECHNRNKSATAIFLKNIAPHLVRTEESKSTSAEILEFIGGNDHFFLNLSMAASKPTLDAAHGIRNSSMLTGMASNGHSFGIRVSGLGRTTPPYEWFKAASPYAIGKYFEGFTKKDANRVLGDSYVSECAGIGGFAMAASPAITEFVGGTPEWAVAEVRKMRRITLTDNTNYVIPFMNYKGSPTGIDLRKVLKTRILPIMNTGIAHNNAGIGQIGAGIFHAPMKCFLVADKAWHTSVNG